MGPSNRENLTFTQTFIFPIHHATKSFLHAIVLRNLLYRVVLQPLRWRCIECAIHHERDVREE